MSTVAKSPKRRSKPSNPPRKRAYGTGSGSDRANSTKRARENAPAKISKNRRSRSVAPPIDQPPNGQRSNAPRASENAPAKISKNRGSRPKPTLSDIPRFKQMIDRYENTVYGPMRRYQERVREENERVRVEVRVMNLRWRLDAIESEFDAISKELDFIIKVVLDSYGCHRHRGEWRRSHCGKRKRQEQRMLQNRDFLRARHVAKHGPRPTSHSWDYYLHPEPQPCDQFRRQPWDRTRPACPSSSTRPSASREASECVIQSRDRTRPACSSSSTRPSASREASECVIQSRDCTRPACSCSAALPPVRPVGSSFSSPTLNNPCGCSAALPRSSELPYHPPFNPLFPRAMDGTTFLPPAPPPPIPPYRKKHLRRPSERQVKKLYETALAGPPPAKNAGRYTDARIFLFEIGSLGWQRYGGYFYQFFKRRILDRAPKPTSRDNQSHAADESSQTDSS